MRVVEKSSEYPIFKASVTSIPAQNPRFSDRFGLRSDRPQAPQKGPPQCPPRHPALSMSQSPIRKPPQWIKPPPPKRSGGFRKWALGNSNRITYPLPAHANKVGPHPSRFRQAVAEALNEKNPPHLHCRFSDRS